MRNLCRHLAVAAFEPFDSRQLSLQTLSELIDTFRQSRDLAAPLDRDLPGQVSTLQDMDLFIDRMDVIDLLADPYDNDAKKQKQ